MLITVYFYSLIIQDILKNTPRDHTDYIDLENSLDAMIKVANFLNTKKGEANDRLKINSIFDTLTFSNRENQDIVIVIILSFLNLFDQHLREIPSRKYLGEFISIDCIIQNRKKQKFSVFVFNDMLLFTRKKTKKSKTHIILRDVTVIERTRGGFTVEDNDNHIIFFLNRGMMFLEVKVLGKFYSCSKCDFKVKKIDD